MSKVIRFGIEALRYADRRRDLRLLYIIVKGNVALPADIVSVTLNKLRTRSSNQF